MDRWTLPSEVEVKGFDELTNEEQRQALDILINGSVFFTHTSGYVDWRYIVGHAE